jgi:hypothetical protein
MLYAHGSGHRNRAIGQVYSCNVIWMIKSNTVDVESNFLQTVGRFLIVFLNSAGVMSTNGGKFEIGNENLWTCPPNESTTSMTPLTASSIPAESPGCQPSRQHIAAQAAGGGVRTSGREDNSVHHKNKNVGDRVDEKNDRNCEFQELWAHPQEQIPSENPSHANAKEHGENKNEEPQKPRGLDQPAPNLKDSISESFCDPDDALDHARRPPHHGHQCSERRWLIYVQRFPRTSARHANRNHRHQCGTRWTGADLFSKRGAALLQPLLVREMRDLHRSDAPKINFLCGCSL